MFAPRRISFTLKKSDLNKSSVGDRLLYLLLSESGSPPPRRGELRLASLFRRLEVEASKLTTVSFFQPPLVFRPPFFPIKKKGLRQCPIHNGTFEIFIWLIMWKILLFSEFKSIKCLYSCCHFWREITSKIISVSQILTLISNLYLIRQSF